MITALLLWIAAVPQPAANSPKPAPRLYVSAQYGLAVNVPRGLSYCPLPKNWEGDEDGTVLFLSRPAECINRPASDSSTRLTSASVPYITLRYRKNAGRSDNYDGDIPPSQTALQLARQTCARPEVSTDFKLFGQPAVACSSKLSGDNVRLTLLGLFDSGKKLLLLDLHTTASRLDADSKILASLTGGVLACTATPKSNASEKLPPCPKGKAW